MNAKGKVSVAALLLVAFFAGILLTTAGANLFGLGDVVGTRSQAQGTTRLDIENSVAVELSETFARVTQAVAPTVVQVRPENVVTRSPAASPFEGTPFEDFFRVPDAPEREFYTQGLGSGVIIRSNGYIVTNNHVVEGADEVTVVLYNGEEYEAEIVGTDPYSDLAVLKIDAEGLPAVSFGDMDDVRVGQWVLAFGSPLSPNLENTVTAGIISAVGRLRAPQTDGAVQPLYNYIQTDAAINPGNSGGPLVNVQGELIGINAAIYTRTGGYQGISFAIPVDIVKDVVREIIETGGVQRARLGVRFNAVSETLEDALNLPEGAAQVALVVDDSPAAEAGIQAGDIITAIDGEPLTDYLQLKQIIGSHEPGETVEITINRDGEVITLDVELGAMEAAPEAIAKNQGDGEPSGVTEELGFSVSNISPQIAQRLQAQGLEISADQQGVIITGVEPTSEAAREAGLGRFQIIVEVNNRPVEDLDDFEEIYRSIDAGETFLLTLRMPSPQGLLTQRTALTKPE